MSTQQVQAEILGRTVSATIIGREPQADYGAGPGADVILDVDGSRFRVGEDDLE